MMKKERVLVCKLAGLLAVAELFTGCGYAPNDFVYFSEGENPVYNKKHGETDLVDIETFIPADKIVAIENTLASPTGSVTPYYSNITNFQNFVKGPDNVKDGPALLESYFKKNPTTLRFLAKAFRTPYFFGTEGEVAKVPVNLEADWRDDESKRPVLKGCLGLYNLHQTDKEFLSALADTSVEIPEGGEPFAEQVARGYLSNLCHMFAPANMDETRAGMHESMIDAISALPKETQKTIWGSLLIGSFHELMRQPKTTAVDLSEAHPSLVSGGVFLGFMRQYLADRLVFNHKHWYIYQYREADPVVTQVRDAVQGALKLKKLPVTQENTYSGIIYALDNYANGNSLGVTPTTLEMLKAGKNVFETLALDLVAQQSLGIEPGALERVNQALVMASPERPVIQRQSSNLGSTVAPQ